MEDWDEKLCTAAGKGNLKDVELSLRNGANLEYKDDFLGQTPLMLAAVGGHLEVVTYLASQGSQLEATSTELGRTPLMWAARGGHLEVVTYVVTQGSQLEVTDWDGKTALHCAAQYGRINTTKWLIDQGCSPWVKTKKAYQTGMFHCIKFDYRRITSRLSVIYNMRA